MDKRKATTRRTKPDQVNLVVRALSKRCGDWLHLMTEDDVHKLADLAASTTQKFPANVTIFAEGQKSASCLWILLKGHVQVKVRRALGNIKGDHVLFSTKTTGTTFGDSTFFSAESNNPTSLETITESTFIKILQETYHKIYDRSSILKVKMISLPATAKAMACLKCEIFQMMSALELSKISESASCLWFHAGERIYSQGDSTDVLGPAASLIFMLDSGKIEIRKERQPPIVLDTPGSIFGESAALLGAERGESAVAAAECRLFAFDKEAFDLLWLQRPDIHAQMLKTAGEAVPHQLLRDSHVRPFTPKPAASPASLSSAHGPGWDPAPLAAGADAQQRFLACIQDAAPLTTMAEADAFVSQVGASRRIRGILASS